MTTFLLGMLAGGVIGYMLAWRPRYRCPKWNEAIIEEGDAVAKANGIAITSMQPTDPDWQAKFLEYQLARRRDDPKL